MKEFEGNELDSTCGISDEELTKRFIRVVEIEIEKMKAKGLPIARYERETGRVYFEYPDGRKEYLNFDDDKSKNQEASQTEIERDDHET